MVQQAEKARSIIESTLKVAMKTILALLLVAPAAALAPARPAARMSVKSEAPLSAVAGRVAGAAALGAGLLFPGGALAAPAKPVAPQPGPIQYAQLEDCATSKNFAKRQRKAVATLEGRLKKYEPGSPPYLALQQTLDQTNNRFKRYGDSDLLCGKDGLPHLVVDGNPVHLGEFVLPGIGFLYTAGYIGSAGRKYVKTVAKTKNPAENEIIIDVPLALTIMLSNYLWPLKAWDEFIAGDLVADKDEITVSPR